MSPRAYQPSAPLPAPSVAASAGRPDGRVGNAASDAPKAVEGSRATGPLGRALDRAPEQVEDLGHDDHARDPVAAQGLEQASRVAAPNVQDVRPDAQRVD